MKKSYLSLALLVALVASAHGQTINFQLEGSSDGSYGSFNGTTPAYKGQGAAPDTGTFWNQVGPSATTSTTSFASDGTTVTGVTLTLGADYNSFNGPQTSTSNGLLQGFRSTGGTGTFTFAGLTSGATYDLYLYGINGDFASHGADFTLNGTTLESNGTQGDTFQSGVNYVEFTDVVVSGSGAIGGTFVPIPHDGDRNNGYLEADFNGAQIVAVPEPRIGAMLMGGAFLLAGIFRIRRIADRP